MKRTLCYIIVIVIVIVIFKIMLPYNIDLTGKTVFLTGVAGFIGSNLAKQLLKTVSNIHIVGIDSMNDYYDVRLKEARLKEIEETLQAGPSSFTFIRGNIADRTLIDRIFAEYHPQIVVNLAAQAGVRYSITNPDAYIESNLIGFYNILEACRHANETPSLNREGRGGSQVNVEVEHLIYASSSSRTSRHGLLWFHQQTP